jgi:hypothetical protein
VLLKSICFGILCVVWPRLLNLTRIADQINAKLEGIPDSEKVLDNSQ